MLKYKYIGTEEQAHNRYFFREDDGKLVRGEGMGWAHEIRDDGFIHFHDEEHAAARQYKGDIKTFINDLINEGLVIEIEEA